jgi:hypothetical protein
VERGDPTITAAVTTVHPSSAGTPNDPRS